MAVILSIAVCPYCVDQGPLEWIRAASRLPAFSTLTRASRLASVESGKPELGRAIYRPALVVAAPKDALARCQCRRVHPDVDLFGRNNNGNY